MKKTVLILAAAALFCACNQEITPPEAGNQVISFKTYAGGVTKTTAMTSANIANFGAAAYTGSVQVMDNQLVEGGNGSWSYSPLKYWPQSGALYFSAYAPYATADNGITPSYNTTTRTFDLSYALPADEDDQVDLLMAANVDVADCASRPSTVQFTFGHILSRVGLTARYSGSVTTGTTVTLTDVKISGKFVASGDYTVSGGWDNRSASASTIIYDRPAAKLAATTLTTSAQNLLSGDNYVMVIPNEDEVEVEGTITVYYTVTTPDGISMNYVKDASASLTYEPNKTYLYNLIIDLAADTIQFGDVTVSDWGTTVSGDVEVRSYTNNLSVTGLSFSNIKHNIQYTITSTREYDDGTIEQIPWHAEFSTDGGTSYNTSVPDFFDSFTASDIESGTYTAITSKNVGENIDVKFIQDFEHSIVSLDVPQKKEMNVEVLDESLTFNILSNGTIIWATNDVAWTKTISYKLNDGDWTSITSDLVESASAINVITGDILKFRGTNDSYGNSGNKHCYFAGTATFNISGSIMSLIVGDTLNENSQFSSSTATTNAYNLGRLFKNNTNLISAEELIMPVTNLRNYCFTDLFSGCTNLTSAPLLPATTLASNCYQRMFAGCTSLTSAPELPATTLASNCYYGMFYNCTSLSSAPALPATTLASSCYSNMFQGCTSLTSAPELPATTLATQCYSTMFSGCSNLISAPDLPATTLATECYYAMFSGCTNLTTAPTLPATTLTAKCYNIMFKNCNSLVTPPALPATTLANNCYREMFSGCHNLTSAPELPATTMATSCYMQMFYYCTSLTAAPDLPALTLVTDCYTNMFQGCSTLSTIKCLATDIPASQCTLNWLKNCSSSGTFIKSPSMTSWPSGTSGIPSGWTVQDAQ